MDAGYDALEQAASSYAMVKDREEDGRSHRGHREHDRDRGDRDRDHRDRDRERRPRDREERDDRPRDRDRGGERERDYDRDRDRRDRDRDRDGHRERYDRDRDDRRRRRDDNDFVAEPMAAHRDRRPRYEEEPFAQPMRQYERPPPPERRRREDDGGGDWRGPPRRDGRDHGRDGRGGGRQRGGMSPPRSPTPPNTLPIEERHVESSYWDVRPPQFAGIGAMEAKMTGMFTYGPGRVPPPLHLGLPSSLIAGSFPPSGVINPIRQSKRLYIGGVKEEMTEDQLQEFFNNLMHENKLAAEMPGEPVAQVQINQEKSYAFVEFRTGDEASAAMQFDGVMCDGVPLRVRRPKDYIGIDPSLGSFPGLAGTTVGESPNKLFVGGLPTYLNDEQVMELLKSFGELRSFNLVKEGTGQSGESKGFAFCEYLDSSVTDMAIQGLHNFQLGDRTLVVQRAEVGRNTGIPSAIPGSAAFLTQAMPSILQNASSGDAPTSRVMVLLNMVTPEELYSDNDYNDIVEDINDECGKYGEVEGVRIPRPIPKSKKWEPSDSAAATVEKNRKADEQAGVGRVYVMYKQIESIGKAMKAIGGRQFGGRTILVASVPEDEFLGPAPPPPPPEDLDAAAADAVKDIMAGLL